MDLSVTYHPIYPSNCILLALTRNTFTLAGPYDFFVRNPKINPKWRHLSPSEHSNAVKVNWPYTGLKMYFSARF